jgi:hypothetical protein
MPVALGFFGFVRTLNVDISTYLDLLGSEVVDIYIVVPDQIGEFDQTPVLESDLRAIFFDSRIRSLTIQLFKYDPVPHIGRGEQLGLPPIMVHCQYHPYRVISLIGSITRLATAMQAASTDIDTYILTRIDMIPFTSAFGSLTVDDNTVRGWRTCPFPQDGIAEDRLIVCGRRSLDSLAHYYESFPNLEEERFGSEYILGAYMLAQGHIMIPQEGAGLGIPPQSRTKYTHEFRATVAKTYNAALECNPSSS